MHVATDNKGSIELLDATYAIGGLPADTEWFRNCILSGFGADFLLGGVDIQMKFLPFLAGLRSASIEVDGLLAILHPEHIGL